MLRFLRRNCGTYFPERELNWLIAFLLLIRGSTTVAMETVSTGQSESV